jgi:hypothetical protein
MKHGIIRKLVMAGFVLVGLVVIGLLVLKQVAQAPPSYYAEIIKAETSLDEKTRHEQAEVLVGDVVQVRNDIANDPEWTFRLTDKSINAWLMEHPLNDLLADLPEEVRNPRIRFETETLKLAFRWQGKPLESVVSVTLKPEFISTNELQITIQNVQAGLLPISWTRFQNEIQDALNSQGLQAQWKTAGQETVLTLKIEPVMQSRQIEVEKLTVLDGELRITGRSLSQVSESAKNQDAK